MKWLIKLRSLAPDSAGQLNVFWHDGDPLRVDGTEVRVFKEPNKIGFCCLLQREDGEGLKPKVCFVILGDFSDQALKWKLSDEQIG